MTRKELEHVKKILERIKDPDEHVTLAMAYVDKDIKQYDARKGQLKNQYESEYPSFG